MHEITRNLSAIEAGDPHAAEQLLPLVYDELRRLAASQMARENPGQTLQPTALVHEAYFRLVRPTPTRGAREGSSDEMFWRSRGHFFAAAAEAMRRILIENARRKKRIRHGGERHRVEFDANQFAGPVPNDELLLLDESLQRLAEAHPLHARLVELRYFAGLTGDEAAQILEISPSTADRYWTFARAWLKRDMDGLVPKES